MSEPLSKFTDSTWREVAKTWRDNIENKAHDLVSEDGWKPMGTGVLGAALLEGYDEATQLEEENEGLKDKLMNINVECLDKTATRESVLVVLLADTQDSMSLSEAKEKYLPNRDLNEISGDADTTEEYHQLSEEQLTKDVAKAEEKNVALVICKQQMDMYASMTIGGLSEDFKWLRDRVNDALLTGGDDAN